MVVEMTHGRLGERHAVAGSRIIVLVMPSMFMKVFKELETTFLSCKMRHSCEEQPTHWVKHQNYKITLKDGKREYK